MSGAVRSTSLFAHRPASAELDEFQDSTTDVAPSVVPEGSTGGKPVISSVPPKTQTTPAGPSPLVKPAAVTPDPARLASVSLSLKAAESGDAIARKPSTDGPPVVAIPFRGPSPARAAFRTDSEAGPRPCPACGARCACSACRGVTEGNRVRADSSDDEGTGPRSTMCGCYVNKLLTRLGPDYHDSEDMGGEAKAPEPQSRAVGIPMTFADAAPPSLPRGPSGPGAGPRDTRGSSPKLFNHSKFLGLEAHSDDEPEDDGEGEFPASSSRRKPEGIAASGKKPSSSAPSGSGVGTSTGAATAGGVKPMVFPPHPPVQFLPTPASTSSATSTGKKSMFQAMKDRLTGGGSGGSGASTTGSHHHDNTGPDGFVHVDVHRKKAKELNHLLLRQSLDPHSKAGETVWVAKFSPDGQYLATAGGTPTSGIIRIWRVRGSVGVSAGMAAQVVSSIAPDIAPARDPAHSGSSLDSVGGGSASRLRSTPAPESPAGSQSGSSTRRPSVNSESGSVRGGSSEEDLLRGGDGVLDMNGAVFEEKPYREFKGHDAYVVDLAWSKTLLLLSASLDKTVRLWHVSRAECLHRFQHPQEVTSVVCHPTDYRFFLTGCLDKKLRIWSLSTGRVALWQSGFEMITSVAFSPDARIVIAGQYNGVCTFYLTDGLRYLTQVECRNRKGSLKRGRKVTGLEFVNNSGNLLLVTTNDSRVRLINMEDYSLMYKYKGLVNKSCQIRASFDTSGDYIVSGSEDGQVYVWRTHNELGKTAVLTFNKHKNNSYEAFVVDDGDAAAGASAVAVASSDVASKGVASSGGAPSAKPSPASAVSSPAQPSKASPSSSEASAAAQQALKAVTVAVFAPLSTLVLCRPSTDEERMDPTANMLIVTADMSGRIRVFENRKTMPTAVE